MKKHVEYQVVCPVFAVGDFEDGEQHTVHVYQYEVFCEFLVKTTATVWGVKEYTKDL